MPPFDDSRSDDSLETPFQLLHPLRDLFLGLDDDLRRGAWRRGPQVRYKIADRKVHFMPDRRNDRLPGSNDRTRDPLFVEGPQILHRAAATRDDDHVNIGRAAQVIDTLHDLKRCAFPLNFCRKNQNVDRVMAPLENRENVAQCSALGRGHDTDFLRKCRNRPLAIGPKQTLLFELLLELLERKLKSAEARRLENFHDELIFAATFICAHAAARSKEFSIFRVKSKKA